jgi:hypothetical protein
MRFLLALFLLATSLQVLADCKTFMSLEGVTSIPGCDSGTCVSGAEAVYEYSKKSPGVDDPSVLVLSLHSSPWRFYDGDMRILTVEEVAEVARPHIVKGVKRIVLMASWSGVAPDRNEKSLAEKLSKALGGFPVSGTDGFLWLAPDGSTRTTHQAFSIRTGLGQYKIQSGAEVMVSMVAGWPAGVEDVFRRDNNSDGIMRAGAGWDIFFLCPDNALQSFEAAAQLSHPVAGYNAALIRLERNGKGDVEAATTMLTKAASAGDKKAQVRLRSLKEN